MTKKITLLTFLSLLFAVSYANTFTITVANFQFSPSSVNAIVGDTIKWVWQSGSHTTTSTSVPAGAATWSSPMNTATQTFTYKLTVAGAYTYWCIPHKPGMAGTINVSAVLPVSLTAFTVAPGGNAATLKWSTANEQNTAYYAIKRSNDGSHFAEVGRVAAAGNSATAKTYSFLDKTLSGNDRYLYYYLDIADRDGAHSTSAIQSFKNLFATNKLLRQVSPNPMNGTCHLMLLFNADKKGDMLARLYSTGGKLVLQEKLAAMEGINNGHICVGALAAGTYVLVCTMDGKKEIRHLIIQ